MLVHGAILRRLRLLVACLVLSVVAQPAVTGLETPRTIAVLATSTTVAQVRSREVAPQHVAVRATSRLGVRRGALEFERADIAPPSLAALEHRSLGAPPLYLVQQRFLL
jgi:hypothetical protein